MEVGHLERVEIEGKPVVYRGEVTVAGMLDGELFLFENTDLRVEKSPNWHVKYRPVGGSVMPLGAGWNGRTKESDQLYISLSLDAPTMPQRLYLSAFAAEEQPEHATKDAPCIMNIKWTRPRARTAPAMASPLADGIPY